MKIEYKGYTIKPCDNATGCFDLSKTVTRTKKDKDDPTKLGESYEAQQDMAFGMKLDTCYELITTDMTEVELGDTTVSPSEYAEAYRKEKEELKEFINKLIKF